MSVELHLQDERLIGIIHLKKRLETYMKKVTITKGCGGEGRKGHKTYGKVMVCTNLAV